MLQGRLFQFIEIQALQPIGPAFSGVRRNRRVRRQRRRAVSFDQADRSPSMNWTKADDQGEAYSFEPFDGQSNGLFLVNLIGPDLGAV